VTYQDVDLDTLAREVIVIHNQHARKGLNGFTEIDVDEGDPLRALGRLLGAWSKLSVPHQEIVREFAGRMYPEDDPSNYCIPI